MKMQIAQNMILLCSTMTFGNVLQKYKIEQKTQSAVIFAVLLLRVWPLLPGKLIVDFILLIFFSLDVTVEVLRKNRRKIGVFEGTGSVWSKISGTKGIPQQPFFVSENSDDRSFIWQQFLFVMSQLMRLPDGRTDVYTDGQIQVFRSWLIPSHAAR